MKTPEPVVMPRFRVDWVNPHAKLLQENTGHEILRAWDKPMARSLFNQIYPRLLATTITEIESEVLK
ncbi:hypothetical protein [Roseivirga thermotolerans]|nr:hypothetical protein [Roseivirga thermotolerans]